MLRVNVATRPFYNERGVYLGLALLGAALVGVSAWNGVALSRLSQREAELTARISKEETRAQDLRGEATRLRASVPQEELATVLVAAREANGLIDRRTFSWTTLFNHIEATLPPDVMLTAVRPVVDAGQLNIVLAVIGREVDAIDAFMERLEETGAFRDLLSRDELSRDDGNVEATLVGRYVPEGAGTADARRDDGAPEAGAGR